MAWEKHEGEEVGPNPQPPEMVPLDLDLSSIAPAWHSTIRSTIETARAKKFTYMKLQELGLPIPPDLKAEVEGNA